MEICGLPSLLSLPPGMERRLAGVSNNCSVYFSDSCIDVSFLFLEKSEMTGRSFNLSFRLYPLSCLSLRKWRDDWPEFQTTALFTFRIAALR